MDVELLIEEEIWGWGSGYKKGTQREGGPEFPLKAIKSYGIKAGLSDLAIVLGGYFAENEKTKDGKPAAQYWTATSRSMPNQRFSDNLCHLAVKYDDKRHQIYDVHSRHFSARPTLYNPIIPLNELKIKGKIDDVEVVEYGEYPQSIAGEAISKKLSKAFQNNTLSVTGKKYTFDGEIRDGWPFKEKKYDEYEYEGKRYIQIPAEANGIDRDCVLSKGRTLKPGEAYWIKVEPIEWLRDPKPKYERNNVWVAKQCLFSGIPLVDIDRSRPGDCYHSLDETLMGQYLKQNFAHEMVPVDRKLGQFAAAEVLRRKQGNDLERQ